MVVGQPCSQLGMQTCRCIASPEQDCNVQTKIEHAFGLTSILDAATQVGNYYSLQRTLACHLDPQLTHLGIAVSPARVMQASQSLQGGGMHHSKALPDVRL